MKWLLYAVVFVVLVSASHVVGALNTGFSWLWG
jgi:hypothetical protein